MRACSRWSLNWAGEAYTRQLEKVLTNALQGCFAQMSHLPMASASMLVVATTSLVLALMNTCPCNQPCEHEENLLNCYIWQLLLVLCVPCLRWEIMLANCRHSCPALIKRHPVLLMHNEGGAQLHALLTW